MSSDEAQAAFGAPSGRKRASTLGYWLAALIDVAAIAGAVLWFVSGFTSLDDRVDDLARVPAPGGAVVELESGKNAAYYEPAGEDTPVPRLTLQLIGEDGLPVVVGGHGGEVTYDVGGHAGRAIAGFKLDEGGRYRMAVRGGDGSGVVAVGKGVGGLIVRAVVGGIVIFFGGLLLSGVVIVLTARARRAPTAPPAPTPR